MRQAFIKKRFNESSMSIIMYANKIIDEYQEKGYSLTLRQLYYQFVARDLIENTQKSYKRLGNIINDARLCGFIDWDSIRDLTRNLKRLSTWDSPVDILESALHSYRTDKWKYSPTYVEVWVEKDALIEVVQKASNVYEVPCFSCRGYVSQSAMYEASKRFIKRNYLKCILLHFGDHDPSGIDMTRDIQERLNMFEADVKVIRVALNMNQVQQYSPPPNPAKVTDTRYDTYRAKHGDDSWELDALDPTVINQLIVDNIFKYLDKDVWEDAVNKEDNDKERLKKIIDDLREDYE